MLQIQYKYSGNSGIKQPEPVSLSIIEIVVNLSMYALVIYM